MAGDNSELTSQTETQYFRSVARVGVQVAEALDYAHQQGVIHRDIKPSNLLLDTRGTVWVTDFGLAKAADSDELTITGDIVGTVRYMAPERLQGITEPQSDVYSLGATLYEMLTLQPLFDDGDRLRLIDRLKNENPPPPHKLDSRIPRDLETIVLKAIDKEPTRRLQTAAEFADELRLFLADRPLHIRRSAWWEHTWRWCRRNPVVAGLSVGLLAMVLLICLGSVLAALRLGHAAAHAERAERDAQEQLFDSLFVQAHASRTSQQVGQPLDSLKALAQAARLGRTLHRDPADMLKLRNEAIACLALPDVRLEREWEGNPSGTNGLGFDARFERYAWSYQDEGLRICRVADDREVMRLPTPPAELVGRWLVPRFSPNGRFLAVWYTRWVRQNPLQVWDLRAAGEGVGSSKSKMVGLEDSAKDFRSLGDFGSLRLALADVNAEPEFSADNRTLAVAMKDNSVRLFDLGTGQESQGIALDVLPERLAFQPNGQRLAVSSIQPPRVEVCDVKTGRVLYALPHPAGVQGAAWHPQGRLLATACEDHHIYLWESPSGKPRGILEGHGWEVHDLAFNHTGDLLASFGWDMTLRLWNVETRKQLWHLENIRVVGFRREEPFVATGISDQQLRLWTCVPSMEFKVVRDPQQSRYAGFLFSPNGRWLGVQASEGAMHIWDIAREREVGGFADARYFNWDAAGNALVVTKAGQLLRHSIQAGPHGDGDNLRVGPGEILLSASDGFEPGTPRPLKGGSQLLGVEVQPPRGSVQMFALDGKARKLWARAIPKISENSISPEGRWWAIGTLEEGRGVSILEARTGELVKELLIGDAFPQFSPDSRWLVTTTGRLTVPGGECCLWRTGSWEKVCSRPLRHSTSSPAPLAISPDGALLSVDYDQREVKLLKLETLEEIATLTPPEPGITLGMEFSPNGRYLGVQMNNTVCLWDLQALRRGLRAIDLDWDEPAATDD